MNRRQFLVTTGACALTIGSFQMELHKSLLPIQKHSIGFVEGWFRLLGPPSSFFSRLHSFPNLSSALVALQAGEIQGLLSTPELWAVVRPEILVFNSLSGIGNRQKIHSWVQDNYILLQKFYATHGLNGILLGMTPEFRLRLGRVNEADLDNQSLRQNIRTTAVGSRAIWFEKMGFQVSQGNLLNRLGYQLELVSRGCLEITDAFYPGFISAMTQQNFRMNAVNYRGHRGQKFILDNVTRSGCIVDLLTLKNAKYSSDLSKGKHDIQQMLATEELHQINYTFQLQKKLELEAQINLPTSLRAEILKCNRSYVQAASLTADPYLWARSLRKALA